MFVIAETLNAPAGGTAKYSVVSAGRRGSVTAAVGAVPIRAPPDDDFGWAYAVNDDAVNDDADAIDDAPPDDLPFFDAVA